ncbi:general secretion pathway protein F [Marinospirillum celere]|uniref:General secretion pathway protein F n=1 Tax=Marinospirillum celere TaxID=1122252 RepID=A0A1I1G2Y4_9GAMM|nr:type II secretion system inner membrane protein GspF [Marinospirillum celere]SFC05895.1 general secretion pathway protein F [Marinospirillum celere]
MDSFRYQALDTQGKAKKGVLEAETERHARQLLRDQGLFPRKVERSSGRKSGERQGLKKPKARAGYLSHDQKTLFTRQLATLVAAGLPLENALETLSKQAETDKQRSLLLGLRTRVREGHSLADSLKNWPGTFQDLYVALVAAGEKAGRLDQVLMRLADYLETSQKQRQKATMALVYPVLLTLVSLAIVIALMSFVVPRIVSQFDHAGQTLPAITRGLIAVSDAIRDWGLVAGLALALLLLLIRMLLQKPEVRLVWHRRLLTLPMLGKLSRALNTARLARTVAILTASGIPLLEGLKVARETLGNTWMQYKVEGIVDQVREGVSLHRALEASGEFPPMMVYMVASGEASGELDAMLMRVADLQDNEFQQKVDVSLSLFEPMMILFMGGVVLTIVLAILLPIMQLNDVLNF